MLSKVYWQNLWSTWTAPQALDADEARREYMTKVITLIITVIACGVSFLFTTGWLFGVLPLDSVLITLGMTLAYGSAYWLAYRGHWRAGGYIPPTIIFLTAVYGNWIGGAGAPAMVLYVLAMVLTAILQGEQAQWIMLGLSLSAYLVIGAAQLAGFIVPSRSVETSFANRVVIMIGVYVSLASLLWFLISQFRRALTQTQVYSERLAFANRQLEQEIIVRQQAEESLRQSNATLQALIDCSPLAIINLNREGKVLMWNQAAEALYGWTREEALENFLPIIPEQRLPEYQTMRAQLLKGEAFTNLETEHQRKDGSLLLINLAMAPLQDATGAITTFMSISIDITESQKAKVALREGEQRFALFMQHFPGLAYIKDATTRVLFANEGFQEYLGIVPDSILGKTNQEIFPIEFALPMTTDDHSVLETGSSQVREERYAGRVWSTHKFIIPQINRPPLLGGFTVDITARKQMEEALQLFQYTVDRSSDAIQWLNCEAGFEYVNDQACRSLGYTREELLRLHLWDIDPIYPRERWERNWASYQNGRVGGSEQVETLHRRQDGSIFPVEVSATHLWLGDRELHVAVVRDITERKQAEAALRESEERYRQLVELSPVAMWINQAGIVTYMNPAALRILGASDLQQVIGRAALEFVHPDYQAIVVERITQMEQYDLFVPLLEEKFIRLDGRVVDVEVTAAPFKTEDGRATQVFFQDITERKRAESQLERTLRETRMRFQISQALAGAETEDNVLDVLLQQAELYPETCVALCTLVEQSDESLIALRRSASFASDLIPETVLDATFPAGASPRLYQHLTSQQPLVANEILGDEILDPKIRIRARQSDVGSFALFSLIDGHEGLGFIVVMAKPHGYFDEEKQRLYQTLAEQGAVALRAARFRETIRESQQRLALLVQQSPLAVIEWNLDLQVVSWNPAAARIFGYSSDTMVHRSVVELAVPEEKQLLLEHGQLARQDSTYGLYTHLTQDARRITCEWFSAPLVNVDGRAIGLVSLVQEVTERKQAEQIIELRLKLLEFAATHSLEELLQKTLDEVSELISSPIGFYHFVEADQETLSLQTWSTRTLIEFCQAEGKGLHYPITQAGVWTDCVRERRPVIHNDYLTLPHRKGLPAGHAAITRELVVPILRGERVMAILGVGNKAQAYTDKDVELVSYVADLAWEMTERKQVEAELRTSERRYRALVESQVDLISRFLPDTTLTFVNDAYCQFYGKTREELLGQSFLHWVTPGLREQVLQETQEFVRDPRPGGGEYLNYRWDGQACWIHWVIQGIVDENDHVVELQAVGRDITRLKQAEAEREKLIADLETKNAELERFTYTVSHDLKAPLITMRGFLGFLEKDARAGDATQMRADMKRIVEATDKMQRLLSELLELSRIGRIMNLPVAVPFETIAQEALDLVRGRLEERHVQVDVGLHLPIILGDRARLVEVLQNLVDNAAKFMGDQVEPRILIGQQGTDRDGKPILFVRDNGLGIDPAYQNKVFGLFDKLDPQSEGTGVGLALVKRIVEVHGGRIWVESKGAGYGSTFFFTLPDVPEHMHADLKGHNE